MRAVADKFNWFLVRVPLIITGPLGKKKRAMIFARFSTPGTFPGKLRGEFRAPFSAAGVLDFPHCTSTREEFHVPAETRY